MRSVIDRLAAALADRYRIERELGQGGMATVYLAQDLRHDRKVALKVLKPELAAVLGAERFVVEIKTTAQLQHPHILPLFDSGTADGFLYYVMPYVEGETLRDKLSRETQLGIDEAVRITREVADALDYAHRHGVIHRDIKPENILLHDGRPMVADFGIALAVSAAAGGRMTETGLSLGTPHYMSPEQATAEKELTNRSDIYSLGCVLYEMLTGSPPHVAATAQQIVMKIVMDPARPVTELRRSVPPNVAVATAKALEKLPADRFATAKDFAEALQNPSYGADARLRSAGAARRSSPVLASAVAVAGLMTVVAIWGWSRPRAASMGDPVTLALVPPEDARLVTDNRLTEFALSPDGKLLAYSSIMDGTRRILLRRMDDGVITPLSGTEGGGSPYFSPDGRWLALHTGGRVFKVPVTGGAPVPVSDSVFAGGSWSEDGWIYNTYQDHSLRRRPVGGGPATLVAPRISGERRGPWHAAALPGGAGVLFRHCASASSDSCLLGAWRDDLGVIDLGVAALAGWYLPTGHLFYVRADGAGLVVPFDLKSLAVRGDPVPVLEAVSLTPDDAPNLVWSPSGLLVYVRGHQVESGTIAGMSEGGQARRISQNTGYFRNPIVSPDGSALALGVYPRGQGRIPQLWVLDRGSGTMRPLVSDVFVTAAAWSPDGNELAALRYRPSAGPRSLELVRVRADGRDSLRRVATSDTLAGIGLDWTSDGQWLVTTTVARGRRELVAIPATGSGESRRLVATSGEARWGAVSPSGRWLAYISNESGSDVVYVRSLWESGFPVAVSAGARPSPPQWRRDGRALYFAEADTLRMVELGFSPGPAVTGRRTLPGLTAAMGGFCPCYAPDRTSGDFVVVHRSVPTAALTVVLNWFSDIRRRIAQAGQ